MFQTIQYRVHYVVIIGTEQHFGHRFCAVNTAPSQDKSPSLSSPEARLKTCFEYYNTLIRDQPLSLETTLQDQVLLVLCSFILHVHHIWHFHSFNFPWDLFTYSSPVFQRHVRTSVWRRVVHNPHPCSCSLLSFFLQNHHHLFPPHAALTVSSLCCYQGTH